MRGKAPFSEKEGRGVSERCFNAAISPKHSAGEQIPSVRVEEPGRKPIISYFSPKFNFRVLLSSAIDVSEVPHG